MVLFVSEWSVTITTMTSRTVTPLISSIRVRTSTRRHNARHESIRRNLCWWREPFSCKVALLPHDSHRWHNSQSHSVLPISSFCRHTMSHRSHYYSWTFYVLYANRSRTHSPHDKHTHMHKARLGESAMLPIPFRKKEKCFYACAARALCKWFPSRDNPTAQIRTENMIFLACEKWEIVSLMATNMFSPLSRGLTSILKD